MTLVTGEQRAFIEAGETDELVWTGKPGTGIRFRRADMLLIPFSIMWGGFAIAWETAAVMSGGPWFMRLWGVPFVLAGLYLMVGRFFWDAYVRSRTLYALTADSAILYRRGLNGGLRRVYLPSVANIHLTMDKGGSGTIVFGNEDTYGAWRNWGVPVTPSFEFIGNVKMVYDSCIRAQRFVSERQVQV